MSVMPSLLGGLLTSYCLIQQSWLRTLNGNELLVINLLSSVVLAIGWMPTTFFSLISGYLWGWKSLPFIAVSYMIASALGYYLCSKLDNGKLADTLNEKFPVQQILSKLEQSGFWLAVFCRLSPTLPFAVLNALFAMAKYPIGHYLGGGFLGMLPRTIFAVFLGTKFSHVTSVSQLKTDASTWFALAMIALSFAGLGWIVKKRLF